MCKVLEREGREWALETITRLSRTIDLRPGYQRLIENIERGKAGKPASYVKGVQSVIDELRQLARRAA